MSRTKHHLNQRAARQGVDMWKPRPLAGASKTAENLKLERRLARHTANQQTRIERALQASLICPVTGCWYGWSL